MVDPMDYVGLYIEAVGSATEHPEYLLLLLFLLTVVTIALFLSYSGIFTAITVSTVEPSLGEITLAYKLVVALLFGR